MRERFGLQIDVSVEPEQAGTGGALWHARGKLDPSFFMLNGDSWFDINILELARLLDADPALTGAIAARHLSDTSRYGVAIIDNGKSRNLFLAPHNRLTAVLFPAAFTRGVRPSLTS